MSSYTKCSSNPWSLLKPKWIIVGIQKRRDRNHSRDWPKVDGTWRELNWMRRRSRRMRVKEGRLGVPSVCFSYWNEIFFNRKETHRWPYSPLRSEHAHRLRHGCRWIESFLLKKITVHSFHYPDRRDGPSGFERSEESDSVFFFLVDWNVY